MIYRKFLLKYSVFHGIEVQLYRIWKKEIMRAGFHASLEDQTGNETSHNSEPEGRPGHGKLASSIAYLLVLPARLAQRRCTLRQG